VESFFLLILQKKPVVPESALPIELTKGMTAYVSPEDFTRVNAIYWRAVKSAGNYYARYRRQQRGKIREVFMHHFVMSCQAWEVIHHIDHNTLNNCRENLQILTAREHRHYDGWHYYYINEGRK
jgi:hypothetical protein